MHQYQKCIQQTLKEKYGAIKTVLKHIKYEQHRWVVCVNSKMVNFLLGQQSGCTKFPCFLCIWDSRVGAQSFFAFYAFVGSAEWVRKVSLLSMHLLGQQNGSTKFPCFLWIWDSRVGAQSFWPVGLFQSN